MTKGKERDGASADRTAPSSGGDFGRAYADMRGVLMRFAARYFRKSPHDVEDVVQDAFLKAIEADRRRSVRSPEAYLFEATKNLALNAVEKKSYRLTDTIGDLLPETVMSQTPSVEDQFEARERFELFCLAVQKLPPKRREAFVLRRVYGFSQKEVAEKMGVSLKTVEAHLAKAITQCAAYMEELETAPASEGEAGVVSGQKSGSGDA